jgi:hypothetical protein
MLMKSHDGLKDSLTNLAVPAFLYVELKRELARATRNGNFISGVKIILKASPELGNYLAGDSTSINEREILLFAQSLQHETRGEDICARMGEAEFLVLLIGYQASNKVFLERLLGHWKIKRTKDFKLKAIPLPIFNFSFAHSHSEESSLDFLNRLDLAALHSDSI